MKYYLLYIIFKKFLPNICFFTNIYLYIIMIMYFIKLILILVFNVCVSIYYINCSNCKCCGGNTKSGGTGSGSKGNSNILPGKGGLEEGGLGGAEQEQEEEHDEDLRRKEEEKIKEQQRIKEVEQKKLEEERIKREEEKKKKKKKEDEEELKRIEEEKLRIEQEEKKRLDSGKEDLEIRILDLKNLLSVLGDKMFNKKFDSINIPSTGSRGGVKCTCSYITKYLEEIKAVEDNIKTVNTEEDINKIYTKIDKYSSIIQSIKEGIDTACEELEKEINELKEQSESIFKSISSTLEKINKCPGLKKYIEENLDENYGDTLKQIGNGVNDVIGRLKPDISTNTLKTYKNDILLITNELNKFLEKIKEYEVIEAYNKYLQESCNFLNTYCIDCINKSDIRFVKNGDLCRVYTEMTQKYARLPENTVDEVIKKGGKLTYRKLKEKIDDYYKNICELFNEIKILLAEVQTNLVYDNYIANTIAEVGKRRVEFNNKYNKTRQNFEEKCRVLLYLYHWEGRANFYLDKIIIDFSEVIENYLELNKK